MHGGQLWLDNWVLGRSFLQVRSSDVFTSDFVAVGRVHRWTFQVAELIFCAPENLCGDCRRVKLVEENVSELKVGLGWTGLLNAGMCFLLLEVCRAFGCKSQTCVQALRAAAERTRWLLQPQGNDITTLQSNLAACVGLLVGPSACY